ncbi:MAG: hypothetical protein ACP5NV_06195, partial [Candidatus Woesearchaeota archaeon]
MSKQLIIRGQVLDLPQTPLKKSLEALLIMQGFLEMKRDYSESIYERVEGCHESGTSWDIYSIFSDTRQQVFHHLLVDEYRLFKEPVDILGAQYIENI